MFCTGQNIVALRYIHADYTPRGADLSCTPHIIVATNPEPRCAHVIVLRYHIIIILCGHGRCTIKNIFCLFVFFPFQTVEPRYCSAMDDTAARVLRSRILVERIKQRTHNTLVRLVFVLDVQGIQL